MQECPDGHHWVHASGKGDLGSAPIPQELWIPPCRQFGFPSSSLKGPRGCSLGGTWQGSSGPTPRWM